MVFLEKITLLDSEQEGLIKMDDSYARPEETNYPLDIFPDKDLQSLEFEPITLIYGGNGSGKSTLLNIIASKLGAERKSEFNKGLFFDVYVECSKIEKSYQRPMEIKAITSDDVFDYLLDIRAINSGIRREKDYLAYNYDSDRYSKKDVNINDYETIKNIYDSKTKTKKSYVRSRLSSKSITEHSNGESALLFWEREIKENSIYILDEPENSLSAENQIKLKNFIEESVRFYNCQFIISTHSPFLLSLSGAKIYDLDSRSCKERPWTELGNVKLYYDFFKKHENEFEQ